MFKEREGGKKLTVSWVPRSAGSGGGTCPTQRPKTTLREGGVGVVAGGGQDLPRPPQGSPAPPRLPRTLHWVWMWVWVRVCVCGWVVGVGCGDEGEPPGARRKSVKFTTQSRSKSVKLTSPSWSQRQRVKFTTRSWSKNVKFTTWSRRKSATSHHPEPAQENKCSTRSRSKSVKVTTRSYSRSKSVKFTSRRRSTGAGARASNTSPGAGARNESVN